MIQLKFRGLIVVLGAITCIVGCSTPDDRLTQLSQEHTARQAEQSQQMARQSQEIAETARHLVEADARARQEMIAAQSQLQHELQAERGSLDRQHEALEAERKQLATERRWEPILATALWQVGTLIACMLPLALGFIALWALRHQTSEEGLGELLVHELVADASLVLDAPQLPAPDCDGNGTATLPHPS